jgi:exodeoxyribonuclease-3
MLLVGDLNIAPHENDVWSHKQLIKIVSHTPIEVERLKKFQSSYGFIDSIREFHPYTDKIYSWWSYRSKNWEHSNKGRRLDHIWASPELNKFIKKAAIEKKIRRLERPSDHVPLIVDFEF